MGEGFEQNNISLSAEQQGKLNALFAGLYETNESSSADSILEAIDGFLEEQGIDMSPEQKKEFIRNLSSSYPK